MNTHQIILIIVIIVLTLISGIADAQGFTHASVSWIDGRIVWMECLKAFVGFGLGAVCYILVTNYLRQAGIVAPEVQTILWFTVTIIGVALISGKVIQWRLADQLVALVVLSGVAWLLVRTGG